MVKKRDAVILLVIAIIASPIENFITLGTLLFHVNTGDYVRYIDLVIYIVIDIYLLFSRILFCMKHVQEEVIKSILLTICFVLLYFISSLITPGIIEVSSNIFFSFVIKYVTLFYLGLYIDDASLVVSSLAKVYPWISFVYGITAVLYSSTNVYAGVAMMSAYDISVGGMVGFAYFLLEKKKITGIISLAILVITLMLGSRGAFAITAFSFLWSIHYYYKDNAKRKVIFVYICLVSLILLYFFYFEISNTLITNSSLRILSQISSGMLFDDSGRSGLINYIIRDIMNYPFSVRGLFADRVYLSNYFGGTNLLGRWIDSGAINIYTHNIILEIIFQFGVVLGGTMIVFLFIHVFKSYRAIIRSRNEYAIMWSGIVLTRGLLVLLISSSYLENPWFYMLLALLFKSPRIDETQISVDEDD